MNIQKAIVSLRGITPYSPSRYFDFSGAAVGNETAAELEAKHWRNRVHFDDKGMVYVPPMALKKTVEGAAAFLGRKIPGRGAKTYKSVMKAALMVMNPLELNIHIDDVKGNYVHVPSDGVSGGSKRVMKKFAVITPWSGTAEFLVLDNSISKKALEDHIEAAGNFVGLGSFRPSSGGYYGRFAVEKIKWEEVSA